MSDLHNVRSELQIISERVLTSVMMFCIVCLQRYAHSKALVDSYIVVHFMS